MMVKARPWTPLTARYRRLGGVGLAIIVLSGLSCATLNPQPPQLADVCLEMLDRGVFHAVSLESFPEIERPLEGLLCATTFTTHRQLNDLGFGYGTSILGQTLREADPRVRAVEWVDQQAAQRWRQEHCDGPAMRSEQKSLELRDQALDLLPASLVGPWRSCRSFLDPEPGVRCILLGSYDRTGEDEMVHFEAVFSPGDPMEFGTRLKKDLIVRGADCGGAGWGAGTRIGAKARLLSCRRRGRSAVSFEMITYKGRCEGRLPAVESSAQQERDFQVD